MKGLRFIPSDTRIGFIRYRMISFAVSGLLMLASLGLFFTTGLNYGIDFKGGTLIEVRNKSGPIELGAMRSRLSKIGVGEVQIQEFGAPSDVLRVDWRMRVEGNEYKIVDIVVEGVSIASTLRSEYTLLIRRQEGDVGAFVNRLREEFAGGDAIASRIATDILQ